MHFLALNMAKLVIRKESLGISVGKSRKKTPYEI